MNKIEDSPGNPNVSEADKSAITTPEQDKSKEERARILIEEIVSDKIKPLESSISQIPGLIKQTISQVLGELQQAGEQAAPQQAPGQPTQIDNEKLAGIAKIAEAVAPFFGQKTAEPDPLLNMIKDAFAKMIQAKVDETIMGTYGTKINPPPGLISQGQTTKYKLNVE